MPDVSAMKVTPMMRQYLDIQERYPDAVIFFRLGDFYEVFFEDAEVVARELEITLTSREQGDEEIPMAGVPVKNAETYVNQLIDRGFTVAICEQVEDADQTSGLVKRDVVRLVTPGVVLDTDSLDAKESNYVTATSLTDGGVDAACGIASLDVSTGEFRVTEVDRREELISELNRIEPQEVLVPDAHRENFEHIEPHLPGVHVRDKADQDFDSSQLLERLDGAPRLAEDIDHDSYFLSRDDVDGFLSDIRDYQFESPGLVERAAAALLDYVIETQRGIPSNIQSVEPYRARSFLIIDDSTKANLELTETLMGGRRQGSLLSVIDKTVTAMGGRRLRQWLNYPLIDPAHIRDRLDGVEEVKRHPALRDDLRAALTDVYDIERLCSKISSGTATARDLRNLLSTLSVIPSTKQMLAESESGYLLELGASLDPCADLRDHIDRALVDDPPQELTEGGLFKRGYHDELDELIDVAEDGKDWLLDYEQQQIDRTDIDSLKVKYNKVFGYFIEVTKANLDKVPDDYMRKQTLSNSERYITEELEEMQDKILNAEEERKELEYSLFQQLREKVGRRVADLLETASLLADLDAISGLAELAAKHDYCRPEITDDRQIDIEEGRHPVVEQMLDDEPFVPNSVDLSPERRLQIITGPNMSGKSTVIRQVAVITLLAQMGSFVPADRASIGVVDKIFSRVGASDNLAKGQSTFMVEMTEAAHILNNATDRSLVILDEIGRGTSTFDGLSIAWAVAEHLHDDIGAKTMFATHYHELTELTRTLDCARNLSIAVKEWQDDIIFLRKLVDGEANRSYGIQVGKLAGLPQPVVDRAKQVLDNLESGQFDEMGVPVPGQKPDEPPEPTHDNNPAQLSMFQISESDTSPEERRVLERLREIDAHEMTPMESLQLLGEIEDELDGDDVPEDADDGNRSAADTADQTDGAQKGLSDVATDADDTPADQPAE
jgi:DNA mismatch repair protein MutS